MCDLITDARPFFLAVSFCCCSKIASITKLTLIAPIHPSVAHCKPQCICYVQVLVDSRRELAACGFPLDALVVTDTDTRQGTFSFPLVDSVKHATVWQPRQRATDTDTWSNIGASIALDMEELRTIITLVCDSNYMTSVTAYAL